MALTYHLKQQPDQFLWFTPIFRCQGWWGDIEESCTTLSSNSFGQHCFPRSGRTNHTNTLNKTKFKNHRHLCSVDTLSLFFCPVFFWHRLSPSHWCKLHLVHKFLPMSKTKFLENNTWAHRDMEFIFKCSTRYLSPRLCSHNTIKMVHLVELNCEIAQNEISFQTSSWWTGPPSCNCKASILCGRLSEWKINNRTIPWFFNHVLEYE